MLRTLSTAARCIRLNSASAKLDTRHSLTSTVKFPALHPGTRHLSFAAATGIALLAYRSQIGGRTSSIQSRHLITTIDPSMAYTPHAPSPFIVSTDSPLSNLLEGYKKVDAGDSTPYAVFDKPIEQSPNDDRQYRSVRSTRLRKCSGRVHKRTHSQSTFH